MKTTRSLTLTAIATTALLLLSGCGSAAHTPAPADAPASEAETAAFPRTIEIPAGRGGDARSLTIETEPTAIAALDYESAEVIAELGLTDRLVLIPEAVLNPAIGGHVEAMSAVPATFPVAMNLDAETVIGTSPDLVVMSPRHGADDTIGAVLEQAGLTTLQLPDSWSSPKALAQNIDLIGQTTGAEDAAVALTEDIEAGLAKQSAQKTGALSPDAPQILMLTNQAGRPFATAGSAFPLHLLDLAGAVSVTDSLGMDTTGAISAEQIVAADPDGLVLIDMNGTGDRMYAELLANPAVAALPAASPERIMRISGREVQALGLVATVTGLESLTAWVATLR